VLLLTFLSFPSYLSILDQLFFNFHLFITTQQPQALGCGTSKPENLEKSGPAYPVTNTMPPPPNHAALQPPTAQNPSKGKKRKAATNLGLLSTLVN
jgi:hypothetical protein